MDLTNASLTRKQVKVFPEADDFDSSCAGSTTLGVCVYVCVCVCV